MTNVAYALLHAASPLLATYGLDRCVETSFNTARTSAHATSAGGKAQCYRYGLNAFTITLTRFARRSTSSTMG